MGYPPKIQKLLEKYWDAETSVGEEREIRNYFLMHPEHADAHTTYFLMLSEDSVLEAPSRPEPVKSSKVVPLWKRMVSIAAAALVLISAGMFLQRVIDNDNNNVMEATVQEIEDPDKAYQEAKEALMLVSKKLNSSTNTAAKGMNKVEPYTTMLK